MKRLKPTVFVPTSLALAMAVVLPSMAFAEIKSNATTYQDKSSSNTMRTTIGYNGTVYQDSYRVGDLSVGWKAIVRPHDITLSDTRDLGNADKTGIADHALFSALSMNFYTLPNTADELDIVDSDLDFSQPTQLFIKQARFGQEGVALFDHNSQNGVFMDNEQLRYVIADRDNNGELTGTQSAMFLSAGGGISFGKIDNEGAVTPTGVTITQDGIKSVREAKADDDVVTLGKVKSEIKDSEQRITRSLNASIAGMIGVPPSSPPPSAAIKKLNDSLAATDKRLDESNQRLNSAIDINDGVLTIKNDMNANNKKITKVANATDDGDAVNLGQLKAYVAGNSQASAGMNQLKGDVVRLDKNLKQGMAAQSALNGLFQPYGVGKFSATAAIGGYGTETAVAVGTGYRFNENLAGKGGIAFPVGGASQATYNLGINYEW